MAMRKLKHHEQKLLKKTNFTEWKTDSSNTHEAEVIRRYHIQKREDYVKYNKIVGFVTALLSRIEKLDAQDPFRAKISKELTAKLYQMGVIPTGRTLAECKKVSVSAFCRRRLPVVLVRLKMSATLREAITYIEQGHIRVGPETVTDPAFLVTRAFEDHVKWVDGSKIVGHIMRYNDKLDDYLLLGN